MITKGIIEKVITDYCVKVRLPVYDKVLSDHSSTKTEDLYDARFCTIANSLPNPRVNDVVYVGFEDNDQGKPIILGYLCRPSSYNTYPDIHAEQLLVNNYTHLSSDTSIGNISPKEISYLKGLVGNIQGQLDNLTGKINSISTSIGPTGSVTKLNISITNITNSQITAYRSDCVVVVSLEFTYNASTGSGTTIITGLPKCNQKVWSSLYALSNSDTLIADIGAMATIDTNATTIQLYNGTQSSTYVGQLIYLTTA